MQRSIYWKITVPLIILVLLAMGSLGFFMANSSRNTQINHLQAQLINEAKLVANISSPDFTDPNQRTNLNALTKTISGEIGTRITFIAIDGLVLGDSDQDPANMENHSTRPEVIAALSTGEGQATRYSATLHMNMMYVAVLVKDQTQNIGIARVALPLTAVNASVNSQVKAIISGTLIAALLFVLAAAFINRMITRPLRQITKAAEGITAGNLDQQIPIRT